MESMERFAMVYQSAQYLESVHTNLISFPCNCRAYGNQNLTDDLKLLYRTAGLDGKGITFVFTDNEIKEEGFLEYMNNVLSSGEVANLFAKDEMDEIQQALVPIMKKEQPKRPPTQENLYDYFISRARNNLHVVLCFSPVRQTLFEYVI